MLVILKCLERAGQYWRSTSVIVCWIFNLDTVVFGTILCFKRSQVFQEAIFFDWTAILSQNFGRTLDSLHSKLSLLINGAIHHENFMGPEKRSKI